MVKHARQIGGARPECVRQEKRFAKALVRGQEDCVRAVQLQPRSPLLVLAAQLSSSDELSACNTTAVNSNPA